MSGERQPLLDTEIEPDFNPRAAEQRAEESVAALVGPDVVERLKSRAVRDFADGLERLRTAVVAQFARDLDAELRRAGAQLPAAPAAAVVPLPLSLQPQQQQQQPLLQQQGAPDWDQVVRPSPRSVSSSSAALVPQLPVTVSTVRLSSFQTTRASKGGAEEAQPDVVQLNVGGVPYTTSRRTLLSVPETFFHTFLSEARPASEDGRFFIDRDGAPFGGVLNYLRDREAAVLPRDDDARRRLLAEARFYGLVGLARVLNSALYADAAKMSLSSPRSTASGTATLPQQAPSPPPQQQQPQVPAYVPVWDEDRKHSVISVYGMSIVRGGSKNDDAVALGRPVLPTTGVHHVTFYVSKKPKRSCYYFGLVKAAFKDYGANLSTHRWAWVYDDVGAVSCNSIQMGVFTPVATGSRLEMIADMDRQTLTFIANGKKQTSVFLPRTELVPAVSLYNPGSEVCFSIDS